MNKRTQQRIVGAIAVIALIILIIPHILSSDKTEIVSPRSETASNIASDNMQTTIINMDDLNAPKVTVDPIPVITDNSDNQSLDTNNTNADGSTPISESLWSNVTGNDQLTQPILQPNTQTASTNNNSDMSLAERLLAEAKANETSKESKNAQGSNTTNAPSMQLPKIELIGTSQNQNRPKTDPTHKATQNVGSQFTWYVQVGSYSSLENANKNMEAYRKQSYVAEVELLSGQYKVRIGPLKTQENAQKVQAELKRQGVNSYIVQIK